MTLNFVIPVSMVIETIMLTVQSVAYAYNRHHIHGIIDEIFLGVASLFIFLNMIWLIWFFKEGRRFDNFSRAFRASQGVAVFIVGSILIASAVTNEDENCMDFYSRGVDCQKYEAKLAAGIIALIDGIFYFCRPITSHNSQPSSSKNVIQTPGQQFLSTHVPNLYYVQTPSQQPPPYFVQNGEQLNMGIYYGPSGPVVGFNSQQQFPDHPGQRVHHHQQKKQQQYQLHHHKIPRITEYYVKTGPPLPNGPTPTGIHNLNYQPNWSRRRSSAGNIDNHSVNFNSDSRPSRDDSIIISNVLIDDNNSNNDSRPTPSSSNPNVIFYKNRPTVMQDNVPVTEL